MDLEELSKMSLAELKAKANEKLASLGTVGLLGQGPILSEAQFYIDEIERRAGEAERKRQAWITTRDLILEVVVILLIGAEIYFGITGGNKQLEVSNTLNLNATKQLELLQKMNTNAETTATILAALKEEQEKALVGQQQNTQLVSQMNGSLRTSLGLNFAPALTMVYDQGRKKFSYQNFGKTNIFLWGQKYGEDLAEHNSEPRMMTPGAAYEIDAEPTWQDASKRVVAEGQLERKQLDVYMKTADGKKYTASFYVIAAFTKGTLTFNTQEIGIKDGGW